MDNGALKIKKNDIILLVVLLCAAAVVFMVYRLSNSSDGKTAVVSVDGAVYAKLSLNEDTVLRIKGLKGYDTLVIENGQVRMLSADCPDQVCVKHRAVKAAGESIVCLPNRIIVEITSEEEMTEIDGVAR